MHALAHEVILPWNVFDGECGEHIYIMDAEDSQVVRFHKCQTDIAKRVVASMNACRGISTEELLNSHFGDGFVEVGTLLGQTMQQRDELLEALQQIARANEFDVSRGRQCAEEMRQVARNSTAKATGHGISDSEGGHCD